MIGSFKQYLVEEEKTVYFTFGRLNPPTRGHEMLLNKLAAAAGKNPYRIYLSKSNDPKKNPLSYNDKIKFARKMFPKHARQIIKNDKISTIMQIASELYKDGFVNVVMAVDGPRSREFDILLNKYNGTEGRHGFYNFKSIKFINVGERDDSSEGIDGVSATKQRNAAKENDFVAFSQGLPKAFSNADSKALFNAVRKGMGLKEATDFRNHVQLEPVSEVRESYVDGKLFNIGDEVVIKENGEIGKVKRLGPNYVIVETKTGQYRKWLDAVEKVEQKYPEYTVAPFSVSLNESKSMYKDKPDWGTPESTKKAKKMTPGEVGEAGPCWAGYKQVGTKMKNGKAVPNCVPEETVKEKIEVAQDKDIDDRKGSQPATFQMGIKSKSTKAARDAHFKKMAKRDDHKNPDLYKPAPGDATAKTKPSQYTKRFKAMYGEETDPVDIAKQRIDREKKADAQRHDRMMDRARTRATTMKNKETKPNG
jgi:hypothetical protein